MLATVRTTRTATILRLESSGTVGVGDGVSVLAAVGELVVEDSV